MDIGSLIPELLMKHLAVSSVTLTGSRLRGDATEWSDWDFLVETADFEAVSKALPSLTESLDPLNRLWDPLSHHKIYMIIIRGPVKIDLIFDHPQQPEPPWTVSSNTISLINSHFWDWILWLASKEVRRLHDVTREEFQKMCDNLLAPLGCLRIPSSVEEAVREYLTAFDRQKSLFKIEVDHKLETEVIKGLRVMGFKLTDAPGNDDK
ncbi:MAG TPA: nucleotidyltransferase domain-containing protein [Dehalococcoidia bacterium]|nr:nucleotidyltransferase domain-containing protein [Dehalococcoidia bacterium]